MAFGKKKDTTVYDQNDVISLATAALRKRRETMLKLPLRIRGVSPLLMHRWGQKSLCQMLAKMVGIELPREFKDLTKDYEESRYFNERGDLVVPCRHLKAAIIGGATETGKVVSKAELKRNLRVVGFTSPIRGNETRPHVCTARNNSGNDVRSRAIIDAGYYFDVVLQFPCTLSPDKVMSAIESAGCTIGICDWRLEKGGEYGAFDVEPLTLNDVDRIVKECSSPEVEYNIPPEYMRAVGAMIESLPADRKKVVGDANAKMLAVLDKVNADAHIARNPRRSNGARA